MIIVLLLLLCVAPMFFIAGGTLFIKSLFNQKANKTEQIRQRFLAQIKTNTSNNDAEVIDIYTLCGVEQTPKPNALPIAFDVLPDDFIINVYRVNGVRVYRLYLDNVGDLGIQSEDIIKVVGFANAYFDHNAEYFEKVEKIKKRKERQTVDVRLLRY